MKLKVRKREEEVGKGRRAEARREMSRSAQLAGGQCPGKARATPNDLSFLVCKKHKVQAGGFLIL